MSTKGTILTVASVLVVTLGACAYAITGDFEGVTVVAGLDDVVGIRPGELPGGPGRVYIDVAA